LSAQFRDFNADDAAIVVQQKVRSLALDVSPDRKYWRLRTRFVEVLTLDPFLSRLCGHGAV
jgi:hypothetical protein